MSESEAYAIAESCEPFPKRNSGAEYFLFDPLHVKPNKTHCNETYGN